jgi:(1->4)-alpha-D-glucan 1-alpha-D-glucosylmutase
VDYAARVARLTRLDEGAGPADLDDEKLLTTSRALRLRRRAPEVFGEGASYDPLPATSEHALGFLRSAPVGRVASALGLARQAHVVALVTRAPHRLAAGGGWGDATVTLPEGEWRDELTGRVLTGGTVAVAGVLADLPVALLVSR